ncbi:N-acetylmuramoyl-L-alanine amidase [Streptomyces sp. FIT100]|uniref:N-acetylmuramoyl-L-alanine amidase n=1 Tax=Streptomyces sp. FIT100 TaxID=2837956 RepID=UPI0021C799C8|nr:N-acetylmuramoyl-L-alanine amidase [Streptomyces sp. FIT100]UUN26623.1 N-acetylmuramoyl-L-alanine amidase [Streptomyces sp. FIT100]
MPTNVTTVPYDRIRPLAVAAAAALAACLAGCAQAPQPADSAKGQSTATTPRTTATAAPPASALPLAGKTVVVDPGHNAGNFRHTREINALVDIGTDRKECDTTGTATDDGYREADFTLDVSHRLRTLLEKQGATVRFTQDGDRPYGPCVDERARIGNRAAADAVVSVHADGSGAGNRGFHVILPALVKDGAADTAKITGPSRELGKHIAGSFATATGSPRSNYVGDGTGLDVRGDLGGLNLSTVPKVFIECGNMRDTKDAARLKSPQWRQKAASGIADGITTYLLG